MIDERCRTESLHSSWVKAYKRSLAYQDFSYGLFYIIGIILRYSYNIKDLRDFVHKIYFVNFGTHKHFLAIRVK
jgi:hypothetical protein